MPKFTPPVQTELTHCPQDVRHALSPQLLAKDGGGDEAASSTNTSTAERERSGQLKDRDENARLSVYAVNPHKLYLQ